MADYNLEFLRKGDLIYLRYQIKNIMYNMTRDCFELRLISRLKNFPEIKVRVSYYHTDEVGFIISKTNNREFYLTSSSSEYIENMSEIVTNKLKEALKGVYEYEKNKSPKRLSVF